MNQGQFIPKLDAARSGAERLATDCSSLVLGPYHSSLPGLMQLSLVLDGEIIVNARIETGFAHRGIEKVFESHNWTAGISLADRVDPEGAIFSELSYCLAVEGLMGIPASPRSQYIRTLVSELSRISSHLGFVARLARSAGAETLFHYIQRDREKFLDLFELLAGSRFSLNFLRFGGVSAEVSDGLIERILEVCAAMKHRFKEYNDIFSYNHGFLARAEGTARVDLEMVRSFGISGPNARASGLADDVRKWSPYVAYSSMDFDIPVGDELTGDVHARYMIRIREIVQSMEIVKQCAQALPTGSSEGIRADKKVFVPKGEAWARVESARGMLACHVISDGGERPRRVRFRPASRSSLDVVPHILPGAYIEDLPIILASMDLSLAEIDR
jgi:NADH-quinone oxidoreductase subunit D